MKLLILIGVLLSAVSVQSASYINAAWTTYTSYAPCCTGGAWYNASADTTECTQYSACSYLGTFAALNSTLTFDQVKTSNIVAFFDKNNPTKFNSMYANKKIQIKYGTVVFNATILDTCADTDCGGCCSQNADQTTGYLLDMEYWTVMRNFGDINAATGTIQIMFLNETGLVTIDAAGTPTSAPTSKSALSRTFEVSMYLLILIGLMLL
jgi:hypothetical protein